MSAASQRLCCLVYVSAISLLPRPSGRSAGREIGERPTRSQPYQMALAEFMSDGSFAGFLRRMRRIYAERHALLSEGLLRIAPDLLPHPLFLRAASDDAPHRGHRKERNARTRPRRRCWRVSIIALGHVRTTEGASVRIRQHSADADPRWSSAPHGSLR